MLEETHWADVAGLAWRYFDFGASIIWATTGALRAAKRRYDLAGLFAIALVSSTGGGLLRDGLFLQAGPPALVRTPAYIIIAAAASLLVWAFAHRAEPWWLLDRVASVADGFGLGGFALAGMQLSAALEVDVVGALLIGVVNAVGGGILGSLLMREVPEVFRPGHLMALAVLPGCVLYEALTAGFGLGANLAALPTLALIAALRWFSVRYSFRTTAPRRLRVPGTTRVAARRRWRARRTRSH
jgi:uncharacterized membrane protein YeiH